MGGVAQLVERLTHDWKDGGLIPFYNAFYCRCVFGQNTFPISPRMSVTV